MLLELELRKSLPVFVVAVLAMGVPRLLFAVTEQEALSVVYVLTSLIAWAMVVAYICYRLFSYYCLGADLLLHVTSHSRFAVLSSKAVGLGVLTCGLSIASMLMDWSSYVPTAGSTTATDTVWMIVSRMVGVASFLALSVAITSLVKFARQKMVMIALFALALALAILLVGAFSWSIADVEGQEFFLGVSDGYESVAGTATIVPFFALGGDSFVSSLASVSVFVNTAVLIAASGVWALVGRGQRNDFYRI